MEKEQSLAAAEARYDEIKALRIPDNAYDYGVEFVKIGQVLGRKVLPDGLGVG